jgi:hypothetical protein
MKTKRIISVALTLITILALLCSSTAQEVVRRPIRGVTMTSAVVEFDSRNVAGSDNSAASQWDDSSGNASHATQADGSLQPTVQTNELNGHQVVRFVPVDHLNFSGNAASSTFTVIAVVKQTGGSASTRAVLSANTGGLEGDIPTIWLSSNKIELVRTDVSILGTSTTSLNTTNFYTIAVTYDGATGAYAFYLNGSADGSGTAATVTFAHFSRIGARNGNQSSFSGDIAYAGLWYTVLSSAELTARFSDLRTVWAHY